jgi:hypothetical protein
MMEDPDANIYKHLMMALIIGIIITLAFNLYMRERIMENEGFSELYFLDHQNLPDEMVMGQEYNVSFTFANHEQKTQEYLLVIESKHLNHTRNITLADGQKAEITIGLTPEERTHKVMAHITQTGKTVLSKVRDLGYETRHISLQGLSELHQNLTIQELTENPVTEYVREDRTSGNTTTLLIQNKTYKAEGGNLIFEIVSHETIWEVIPQPFIIALYKTEKAGQPLQIHFWHEVR